MIDWKQTGSRSSSLTVLIACSKPRQEQSLQLQTDAGGLEKPPIFVSGNSEKKPSSFSINKLLSDIDANANVIDVLLHLLVASIFCCSKFL